MHTMKKIAFGLCLPIAGLILLAATQHSFLSSNGFTKGTPEIKSISALTFGNDGILFVGDAKSATVFAIDTKDNKKSAKGAVTEIKNIDQKIAEALGTQKESISIVDMAVNPVSKKVYVAVQTSDGTPVLLAVSNGAVQSVTLKDVDFSKIALNNVVAEDAKDGRGRPTRMSTISDMGFANGKVLVSGLSNKEFSSTLRSIPFPFTNVQDESSLEIYHASHGRFETTAPIKTFTTGKINGKDYIIASYTCTPLVLFPLDELKPGTHVKGRTVAEMGSGNTPLDMITVIRNGQPVLLMANTRYPVAKVDYKTIAAFEGTLTERVAGIGGTAFDKSTQADVLQMDKLDDNQVVMIQKKSTGDIDLWASTNDGL
jgi:DNA-binding beta-propeller fold protein YncE